MVHFSAQITISVLEQIASKTVFLQISVYFWKDSIIVFLMKEEQKKKKKKKEPNLYKP